MSFSGGEGAKPLIVILNLDKLEFFNDMYKDFSHLLNAKAEVRRATTPDEARTAINSHPKLSAILSADESLTFSTGPNTCDPGSLHTQALAAQ
jgi:hypothetical protein